MNWALLILPAFAAAPEDPARELEERLARVVARTVAQILSDPCVQRELARAWDRTPAECRRRALRDAMDLYRMLPADCRRRAFRFAMETIRSTPPAIRGELLREFLRRGRDAPARPPRRRQPL
jgi:hypothetical protein